MENGLQAELSIAKTGRLSFHAAITIVDPRVALVGEPGPDEDDAEDRVNRWSDELAGSSGGDS